jgi:hypothetical protein
MKVIKMVMVMQLIVCKLLHAQEIVTDRPGQSNTPVLIGKGAFQMETGFILEEDGASGNRTFNYTYNSSLLKFGINNNFEGRINISYLGLHHTAEKAPISRGLGPVSLGGKIKLADEKGVWPQAAMLCSINLKTGSGEFRRRYTTADINLAFSNTLSNRFSLTYNTGLQWGGEDPEAT